MSDTERLWAAVDQLTKPTTQAITRTTEDDWHAEMVAAQYEAHTNAGFCRIADHRAITTRHGTIPSLWEQARAAVTTGTEQAGGNPSPLAARSPADLDLMETVLTIRESMAWQLTGRNIKPRPGMTAQFRQLAAHIITHEPQHIHWWTYRFEQWARLLSVYLHAVETERRPIRLRGLPCPKCAAKQVLIDTDQGEIVAPPIVIDFVNGAVRAAQCTACAYTWWRGQDLWDLAASEAYCDTPTHTVGETA